MPYPLCHPEGGVEAHTELTDDVHVILQLVFVLELEGAAVGDGAQVLFQFLLGHANAVIGDGQGSCVLVDLQINGKVLPVHAHLFVREGAEVQLVHCVTGVGDQLPEKDLLVGIDRVDHHIKQPLGFCFKLFGFHRLHLLYPEN